MDATILSLVEQLSDSKSPKRRAAAKKLRKCSDPDAGPALLDVLKRELTNEKAWENQYHMIMALGQCQCVEAKGFLDALSKEGRIEMVQTAIGDALVRLTLDTNVDLETVIEFIDRGDKQLIQGAFQAMAMERVIPGDEDHAEKILEYGCNLSLGENDSAVIWLLRTIPGWPPALVEPLLLHWGKIDDRTQQQIHYAVDLARKQQYYNWSPL